MEEIDHLVLEFCVHTEIEGLLNLVMVSNGQDFQENFSRRHINVIRNASR
jgi:hypothetical protein